MVVVHDGKIGSIYKKEMANGNIKSIFLDERFPDFYDNGKPTFDLSLIKGTELSLFDFELSERPTFGAGELFGAEAHFYLNSLDQPTSRGGASVVFFKTEEVLGTEGGLSNITAIAGEGRGIYAAASYISTINKTFGDDFSQLVYGSIDIPVDITPTMIGMDPYIPFHIAYKNGIRFGLKQNKMDSSVGACHQLSQAEYAEAFSDNPVGLQNSKTGKVTGRGNVFLKNGQTGFESNLSADAGVLDVITTSDAYQWLATTIDTGDLTHAAAYKKGGNYWTTGSYSTLAGTFHGALRNREDKYVKGDIQKYMKYATIGPSPYDPGRTEVHKETRPAQATNTWFDEVVTHPSFWGSDTEFKNDVERQAWATIIPTNSGLQNGGMEMSCSWPPVDTYRTNIRYGSGLHGNKTGGRKQDIRVVKENIPAPFVTQSKENSSGVASLDMLVVPTIDITLSMQALAPVVIRQGLVAVTGNQHTKGFRLSRCFAICLSEEPPKQDDNFYDFVKYNSDNNKDFFGAAAVNFSNRMYWQDLTGAEVFDTKNSEICMNAAPTNPTIDTAPTINQKFMKVSFLCAPQHTTSGDDGKITMVITDPITNKLVYPIRKLSSMSGATDLVNNWPSCLSIWLCNAPFTGGVSKQGVAPISGTGANRYDTGYVLSTAMDDVKEDKDIFIRKQIGEFDATNLPVGGDGQCYHFNVGDTIQMDDTNETDLVVTDTRETGQGITNGLYGLDAAAQLSLSRGDLTPSAAILNAKIFVMNKSDAHGEATLPMRSTVIIDSVYCKSFNYSISNATVSQNNPSYGDLIIQSRNNIINRNSISLAEMANMDASTTWESGAETNNPAFGPSKQYWSFGFQTKNNIHIAQDSTDFNYLFFSGYEQADVEGYDDLSGAWHSEYSRYSSIRAAYSGAGEKLGEQALNPSMQNNDSNRTTTKRGLAIYNALAESTGTGVNIAMDSATSGSASDPGFNHGFAQNGMLAVKEVFDSGMSNTFTKRENIFCSTRITKILSSKSLQVEDPTCLYGSNDESYVIFEAGSTRGVGTRRDTRKAYASPVDPETSGNDLKILTINGNTINFEYNILQPNDTDYADLVTNARLPRLFIGPRRYWLIFEFGENPYTDNTTSERAMASVLQVKRDGSDNYAAFGATFAETLFTDSYPSQNGIVRDLSAYDTGFLDLKTDYGFGQLQDKTGDGSIAKGTFHATDVGKYHKFEFNKVVQVKELTEGTKFGILMVPNSSNSEATMNWDSEDGSNPCRFWTLFFDEIPSVDEFSVSSSTVNATYPEFKWDITADDAWYGLLLISDKNIYNQYNNAVTHIPLNEDELLFSSVYANGTTAATAGTFTNHAGGLSGPSKDFNGSSDYLKFAHGTITTKPTNKMSIVAHVVPDDSPSGDEYIIFKEDGSGSSVADRTEFGIYLNSSNQVCATIVTSATTHTLAGSSAIPTDGNTPSCVILTIDGTIKSGNIKLFVNGELEDSTGARKATGSTNHWQTGSTIGASGVSNNNLYIGAATTDGSVRANWFDGKLEEIVIYNDCIYPVSPQNSTFTLTKPVKEQNSGAIKPVTARLFIKDYHNIRGKSTDEVAASSLVSYSKPSFNLYG